MSARSVAASLLLGLDPPRARAAGLVRTAALLGVAEGTTRVALSRMVADGELRLDGGSYELAGALRQRFRRQQEGRHPPAGDWDGTWCMAVVGSPGRSRPAAERAATRKRLAAYRLAEWQQGVWVRPDNLGAERPAVAGCTWLEGTRFVDGMQERGLACRLWPLEQWAATARRLGREMDSVDPEADLAGSFAVAAAVVRHLRDDPLLPPALLPPGWPGEAVRRRYNRYEAAFRAQLRRLVPAGTSAGG